MIQLLLEKTFLDKFTINSKDVKKVLKTVDFSINDNTNITEDQFIDIYNRSNDAKKIHILKELIENSPNFNRLQPAESAIMNSLISYGFDEVDNKLITFLEKARNIPLDDIYVNTINNLINNNTINVNTSWLYDNQVYKGNPTDIDYKIKTLAYISDKNNIKKFGVENNPDLTIDNIKTKSIPEIKYILSNITREDSFKKDSSPQTGYSIVRKELNIPRPTKLTKQNITDYILHIDSPEEANIMIKNNSKTIKPLLNNKLTIDDSLKKILDRNYISSEDIDENPQDILNSKIAEYVSKELGKLQSGK